MGCIPQPGTQPLRRQTPTRLAGPFSGARPPQPGGLRVSSPQSQRALSFLGLARTRKDSRGLGRRLSRRRIVALAEESAGWPMALRIERNQAPAPFPADGREVRDIVANWVESRLWEGVDADDRELLLDAGLFEWMDADLLWEVLGARDAMRRLESMGALARLLNPVRNAGRASCRLHPLLKDHCARQWTR